MTGQYSWLNRMAAIGIALTLAVALPTPSEAQVRTKKQQPQQAAASPDAPKAEYCKEFRKIASLPRAIPPTRNGRSCWRC